MSNIYVTSEIGKLKKVLLHRPGNELLNLTPDTLAELLFDDIPYLAKAQKEHDAFAKVLKDNGVEIVYLEDLVAEVLEADENVRKNFIVQFIKEAGINTIKYRNLTFDFLNSIKDTKKLVLKTMEGVQINDLPLRKREIEKTLVDEINPPDKFIAAPLPNLYFTRDNFATVGRGVNLNHMYSETRNRECIYAEYIFKYHPDYKDTPTYFRRNYGWHTEGGDLLNINDKLIAIGISQRTEPAAIDQLAKNFFKDPKCKVETILAFNIPSSRAFMHLDTVFTQIDKYTFTYHPGISDVLQVYEITEGFDPTTFEDLNVREVHGSLQEILEKYLKHKVKLIPCAGGDRVSAEREQWNDGSNTLCIAPGVVVVYKRNELTNDVLRKAGIKVIEVEGAELVRGRGGPRCMSMPLIREDVKW
ncbi:MAG: arginine deiminase [Mollicutes bacterium]|nr:arginine deiminase [Mollicutes bacterium]